MKPRIFFLLFFIFSFSYLGFSQSVNVFTVDSIPSELRKYYNITSENILKDTVLQKKDSVISELEEMWIAKFEKSERNIITDAVNYQSDKHFDKNLTFWYFIQTVVKLRNERSGDFQIWLQYYNKLMHTPSVTSSQIKLYTDGIYNFITENYLMNIKASVWKYRNGTYKFNFDSRKSVFSVQLNNTNLESISTDGDTLKIYKTNGSFIILQSRWNGKNGYADWAYFDYSPDKIKANLNTYRIDLKKNEYKADSVSFVNNEILNYPIFGSFHDKASKRAKKQGFYPYFRSYDYNFEVKSKQDYITFKSGIEMKGPILKYVGSDSIQAQAEYIKNGREYFKAKSNEFSSLDSLLASNQAGITLFLGKSDSITHPNVRIRIKNNEFSFTRNRKGTGNLPYYDSYQKVYITTDNITWNIKDTLIRFYSKLGNVANIKSVDYFTKEDFTKHRMYEFSNPLFNIKKFTRKIDSRSFYVQEYAKFVKKSEAGVVHRLMGLWYEGFLDYNPNTKYVTVKQKLYDYIKFFFDKKDYDVINIVSKGAQRSQNAELYPLINAVYNKAKFVLVILDNQTTGMTGHPSTSQRWNWSTSPDYSPMNQKIKRLLR